MNHVLALPDDILAFVIFPFFSINDICILDVSVSNHALRPLLFKIYSYLDFGRNRDIICRLKMKWFCQRSVFLDKLTLDTHLLPYEIAAIFDTFEQHPYSASTVKCVDLSPCVKHLHASHVAQMQEYCVNMSTLKLCGYRRDELFRHSLPCLTSLDLSKCTTANILAQSVSENCHALTVLKLVDCHDLSNSAVALLARGCPDLIFLNLDRCDKLSDAAVISLSLACSKLSSLSLRRVHKVTDTGVMSLQRCSALVHLDLSGCPKVSNASLDALAVGCTALASLVLGRCMVVVDGSRVTTKRVLSFVH